MDDPIQKKPKHGTTEKQIRGSSLLLAGKFIAVGVNFLTQVLVVRYLTTADYGAFAYALAAVAFFNHVSTLGLRTTVPRFVPIFHENQEFGKIVGTIAITVFSILMMSFLIIGMAYFSPDLVARVLNDSTGAYNLVLIMIFLVPVEALDAILIALFASFTSPRAIFFRRYILGPGLKLLVVVGMVGTGSGILFIGYGYVLSSLFGVLLYGTILYKVLRDKGILRGSRMQSIRAPIKELFLFSASNFTTDVLIGLTPFMATFLLGYFHSTVEVAMFRVVLPLAHLNRIVKMTFETLYAPSAARLFARKEFTALNDLYWRTAVWMSIISFPVFLITFSEAKAATILAYGTRYESSWPILALLSLAYYFVTLAGFNELTLKVVGKIGFVVKIRVLFALLTIAANFIVIPRYGALGAAWATSSMLVLQTIARHLGLRMIEGVHLFDRRFFTLFSFITGSAAAIFLFQLTPVSSIFVLIPLAATVSVLLIIVSKKSLKIGETFPELLKIPFAKRIFA